MCQGVGRAPSVKPADCVPSTPASPEVLQLCPGWLCTNQVPPHRPLTAPPPHTHQVLCSGLVLPGCRLETLVLSETGMTATSFVNFCEALKANTSVTSLDLSSSERERLEFSWGVVGSWLVGSHL